MASCWCGVVEKRTRVFPVEAGRRDTRGMRRCGTRETWFVFVATALSLTSCRSQSPTAAPSAASPAPASARPAPRYEAPPRLTCADGTSGITPAPAGTRWVNGLWSDGWSTSPRQWAPAPRGQPAFWKTFLYVGPDASRWTTLRVVSPASARLYLVPFAVWSQVPGAAAPQLGTDDVARGRRSTEVEACGQQPLGYPGGITTIGRACVTLAVESADLRTQEVRLTLGTPCP